MCERKLRLSTKPRRLRSLNDSPGLKALLLSLCATATALGIELQQDGYHVYPGDNIQDAIQLAAANKTNKTVKVHAGEYRPVSKRQALIWFNHTHDGVHIEAVGRVTLTAQNPQLSSSKAQGFPAVVNHVVYFGDGISSNTVLRGFRITGANNFVSDKLTRQMEPDTSVPKNLFFYTDGGGIKIFGRSYPTIQNVEVVDNYSSPCGAGISVQHKGYNQDMVTIENCVFRRNRAQVTGAAIDLLEGSAARIINCLFIGNASNLGIDAVAQRSGELAFTNSGVLTIFQNSRALVKHCTFTGNRNAADDMGGGSTYVDCLFIGDTLIEGISGTSRYELDLSAGGTVRNCGIRGAVRDPHGCISAGNNLTEAPDPHFDQDFVPTSPELRGLGYHPVPP
jgi:hypothetical protein